MTESAEKYLNPRTNKVCLMQLWMEAKKRGLKEFTRPMELGIGIETVNFKVICELDATKNEIVWYEKF